MKRSLINKRCVYSRVAEQEELSIHYYICYNILALEPAKISIKTHTHTKSASIFYYKIIEHTIEQTQ